MAKIWKIRLPIAPNKRQQQQRYKKENTENVICIKTAFITINCKRVVKIWLTFYSKHQHYWWLVMRLLQVHQLNRSKYICITTMKYHNNPSQTNSNCVCVYVSCTMWTHSSYLYSPLSMGKCGWLKIFKML